MNAGQRIQAEMWAMSLDAHGCDELARIVRAGSAASEECERLQKEHGWTVAKLRDDINECATDTGVWMRRCREAQDECERLRAQEPVAWANHKVGTRSYVPKRTRDEAVESVKKSEISATQEGPYCVVPLYASPVPQPASEQTERREPVVGEKFVRGWLSLNELPGGMMVSNQEPYRFGPIPALTSCCVTTSEATAAEWRDAGKPVLEIWTAP